MTRNVWHEIEGEESRIYHFPNSEQLTVKGVKRIRVPSSGVHYLMTSSKFAHEDRIIVRPEWLYLTINADSWEVL